MSDYPALWRVLGMFWNEDAEGSPDDSLAAYLASGADDVANVVADLGRLLAEDRSEEDLARLSLRLGNAWHVPDFGMTYREFFERLRAALRAVA